MKIQIRSNQMEEVEGLHNDYPYAYHHVDLSKTLIPWHWHEALEFNYIAQGSAQVSTTSQTLDFHAGEAFFVNSNVLTTMTTQTGCISDAHLFHPVFLGGHFKSVFETKYLTPVVQNSQIQVIPLRGGTKTQSAILSKLRQLCALQSQPDVEFQTRNLLSDIWLLLLEELKSMDSTSVPLQKNRDRLLTMMAFIHENYPEKLTLQDIADAASVSTRECLRCFRTSIGQSPMDYMIDYRIRAAKKLLETTSATITDIALQTGFNSSAYFTKMFHRICGKTPNNYRKELQTLRKDLL